MSECRHPSEFAPLVTRLSAAPTDCNRRRTPLGHSAPRSGSFMLALDTLPSRGLCSSARPALHGAPRVYVPVHDTAPPADQVVRTDGTNLLIRSLTQHREREERARKAGADKRSADGAAPAPAAKRPATEVTLPAGPITAAAARGLTVPQLKAALQSKGLPVGGKKEDLLERLLRSIGAASAQAAPAAAGAAPNASA